MHAGFARNNVTCSLLISFLFPWHVSWVKYKPKVSGYTTLLLKIDQDKTKQQQQKQISTKQTLLFYVKEIVVCFKLDFISHMHFK